MVAGQALDRGRVARAVGQEHPVGPAGQDVGGRRAGGHDLDAGDAGEVVAGSWS